MKNPLNQILFGPPGTGKTYHTINKAVAIANPDFNNDATREELKKEYERLIEAGQIVFTTFHQSLSYEDFIEGIKPETKAENVVYEIQDGIFKALCNNAKVIRYSNINVDWDKANFYKMSLGGKERADIHEWCLQNDVISLGYGGTADLSGYIGIQDWYQFRDKFINEFPELAEASRYNIQAAYAFLNMKEGDVVAVSRGNHVIDAIGVVRSRYYWNDQNPIDYFHFRKVEWIAKDLNTSPERFFKKNISQMTIYEFFDKDIKIEAFKELNSGANQKPKNYVLIIDEINRGNVSQIFGELITLIEEDKRIGKAEALEVTLPYSKTKFGVPANLHIVGTMNTADRSVEALDTALRRRFVFEEMEPKADLLTPYQALIRLWDDHLDKKWSDKEWKKKEDDFFNFSGLTIKNRAKYEKVHDNDDGVEERSNYREAFDFEGGINMSVLLKKINKRIEKLLDKDHQIGHAFFMQVQSKEGLRAVFKEKIIPLLQEYFYGDYGKIGLVLGNSFIEKDSAKTEFAEFAGYDASLKDDYAEKSTFTLTAPETWDFNRI